jgi:shikimate dehydrogenase
VLGSPIAHSLSPVLHRAAYAELGLDWTYDAIEVDSAGLPAFLAGLGDSWRGLSLTMPLKRTVMALLDEADPWAAMSGAANTVVLEDGRRLGFNTDVTGAVAAVRAHAEGPFAHAVVLGGGATATSVLLALCELGLDAATVLVRDPARAAETAAAVARHPRAPALSVATLDSVLDPGPGSGLPPADILVSTVPAAAQTTPLVEACRRVPVVFDVIYDPWPTPLAASAVGRVLVGGLDLLVAQAAGQVRLMTGREAPVAAMRAAGERALAARSRTGAP